MKISKLIKQLESDLDRHGDIEVVMQATTLPDGFNTSGDCPSIPDVFESTVETTRAYKDGDGVERLRIYWQM